MRYIDVPPRVFDGMGSPRIVRVPIQLRNLQSTDNSNVNIVARIDFVSQEDIQFARNLYA